MKIMVIAAFLFLFSKASFAVGTAQLFEIEYVRVDRSGMGYVRFKNNLVGERPSCIQAGYEATLSFNTSEDGGKAILSVVLSAQASGKKVYARGTGACTGYGVMEQWGYGYIK